MTATAAPPLRTRARFPWYVLAGAVVLQGATAPGQTVGVSVFVDHLATDLDLSRSAVSSGYLVGTLTGALTLTATVAIWFDHRRGLANGIKAAAGSGLMALGSQKRRSAACGCPCRSGTRLSAEVDGSVEVQRHGRELGGVDVEWQVVEAEHRPP
jgi:hypothetical protein